MVSHILVIALIVFCVSGFQLFKIGKGYLDGRSEYDKVRKLAVTDDKNKNDKDFALFRQIIPTVFAQFRQIIHTFLAQFRQIMHIGSFTCLFVYRQHIINIRNMG